MVTASVLLIHYSSPWTGQAAREAPLVAQPQSAPRSTAYLSRRVERGGKSQMFTSTRLSARVSDMKGVWLGSRPRLRY